MDVLPIHIVHKNDLVFCTTARTIDSTAEPCRCGRGELALVVGSLSGAGGVAPPRVEFAVC